MLNLMQQKFLLGRIWKVTKSWSIHAFLAILPKVDKYIFVSEQALNIRNIMTIYFYLAFDVSAMLI